MFRFKLFTFFTIKKLEKITKATFYDEFLDPDFR